jgi:hypothetical protein
MAATAAAGEPSEAASSLGFITTVTILATLLASTLSLQLFSKSEPTWARRSRLAAHAVWPQGWAFFANYGDLPTLSVFRLGPDLTASSPLLPRQMSTSTFWGLTGVSQARALEAQYIAGLIPAKSWRSCDGPLTTSCISSATPLSLTNRAKPGSLCGSVAFVLTAPGAYAGRRTDVKVVVLNLACTT